MVSGQCSKELHTVRKNKKAYKVTVEDIDFHSIGVSWTCRASAGADSDQAKTKDEKDASDKTKNQPKYLIEGKDLKRVKMLNVFEPCTLQIGDRNFYTIKENDIILMKNEWKRLQKDTLMKGKKTEDPPKIKSKQRDVQVEIVAEDDDGNSSDYEDIESGGNESDAVSVSSNDSHSNAIDGKLTKKKNRGQAAVMTKVLKKKKLKKN